MEDTDVTQDTDVTLTGHSQDTDVTLTTQLPPHGGAEHRCAQDSMDALCRTNTDLCRTNTDECTD